MDARRMEVYTAFFNGAMEMTEAVSAKIVDEETFLPYLETNRVVFFGNGAEKCQSVITHSNALFVADCHPIARNMGFLSNQKFYQQQFEDVAYFEPFYLKDFVTTTSKKKIL